MPCRSQLEQGNQEISAFIGVFFERHIRTAQEESRGTLPSKTLNSPAGDRACAGKT